jgi:hypothetical protein
MQRKLLAVGVIGNWFGPWHTAQGTEHGAAAGPLADGEDVHIEAELVTGAMMIVVLARGQARFEAKNWRRFRAVKVCRGPAMPVPTTVEVFLGATLGAHRDVDDSARRAEQSSAIVA